MNELIEIEAIKRLKYKYFRTLDRKLWDELATCFSEDAEVAYDEGKHTFQGRTRIRDFLASVLGPEIISMHHGHNPEIVIVDARNATGTWYLEDYLIFRESNARLHGAAFYHDEYIKHDGEWLFRRMGYTRTFEETRSGEAPAWELR